MTETREARRCGAASGMLAAPMDRSYVEELHIQSYGCIEDATFRFTPLHALIGPNDSGKSTVLRAMQTLQLALRPQEGVSGSIFKAIQSTKARGGPSLGVATSTKSSWWVKSDLQNRLASGMFLTLGGLMVAAPLTEDATRALQGAQLLRLDPDFLRTARPLIADGQPLRFADERGTGLPALYDALIVRNLPAYAALNQELTRLFPGVQSIQLGNPSAGTKAIGVKLADGTVVPAELMSEGLLYYLAYAVLPHLDPMPLLLIEEPENGLHPARIAEVMRVLRAISKKTQVILATHSPLVINEMRPEEVTVVTRSPEHGTRATPMKDTANFEERSKVYALGELWLSYANGDDEAPLIQGGPRP
jgi:energy-coupling factor transporter ATP-binding protein EcfA2